MLTQGLHAVPDTGTASQHHSPAHCQPSAHTAMILLALLPSSAGVLGDCCPWEVLNQSVVLAACCCICRASGRGSGREQQGQASGTSRSLAMTQQDHAGCCQAASTFRPSAPARRAWRGSPGSTSFLSSSCRRHAHLIQAQQPHAAQTARAACCVCVQKHRAMGEP